MLKSFSAFYFSAPNCPQLRSKGTFEKFIAVCGTWSSKEAGKRRFSTPLYPQSCHFSASSVLLLKDWGRTSVCCTSNIHVWVLYLDKLCGRVFVLILDVELSYSISFTTFLKIILCITNGCALHSPRELSFWFLAIRFLSHTRKIWKADVFHMCHLRR